MENNNVILVACLTIFLVVAINASIYSMLIRKDAVKTISSLQKATSSARHPWKKEDDQLAELAKKVAELENEEK